MQKNLMREGSGGLEVFTLTSVEKVLNFLQTFNILFVPFDGQSRRIATERNLHAKGASHDGARPSHNVHLCFCRCGNHTDRRFFFREESSVRAWLCGRMLLQ